MVSFNAHFDGKVIVPDEPLELAPRSRFRVTIEELEGASGTATKPDLQGLWALVRSTGQTPYDPGEEDALWEVGTLTSSDRKGA